MKCIVWIIRILISLLVAHKDVSGLKNVILTLEPTVVRRFHQCTLRCNYDLEGSPLYTVKWYRGPHEFYRYTPNEHPSTKVFPAGGITVDVNYSNSTQVVLRNVEFNLSGNFSCEVTTEDGFSTRIDTKNLLVVQLPENPPTISVGREPLDSGDILKANCSSPPSRPPAFLRFLLNNRTVAETDASVFKRYHELSWSDLLLELPLSDTHFSNGRLVLQCIAQVEDVYFELAELRLDSAKDPVFERVSAMDSAGHFTSCSSMGLLVLNYLLFS